MLEITRTIADEGVLFDFHTKRELLSVYSGVELQSFVTQLVDDGYAHQQSTGTLLPWSALYRLFDDDAYAGSVDLLNLPPREDWRPILREQGTLSDLTFSVSIAGWIAPNGAEDRGPSEVVGAVITSTSAALLSREVWETVAEIKAFSRRADDMRGLRGNQLGWARIRKAAQSAQAVLTDYLRTTTVVTPEHLTLELRRNEVAGVIEVIPGFDGKPDNWLPAFDRLSLRDRYDVPQGNNMVHVMFTPEALNVLREIKAMPARRVAGDRARAFIRNPYNFLGDDATTIVDASQVEQALSDAGVGTARFFASLIPDGSVSITIEETLGNCVDSSIHEFLSRDELEEFVSKGKQSLDAGYRLLFWEGYEFDLFGDAEGELQKLSRALANWDASRTISLVELLDLSNYTARGEGFGVEKPFYTPYMARKRQAGGWLPDNVSFGLQYPGESGPVAVSLDDKNLASFEHALDQALTAGQDSFAFSGCTQPISVDQATKLLADIRTARTDIATGTFDPGTATSGLTNVRQTLLIKPNVDESDYVLSRGEIGAFHRQNVYLPGSLQHNARLLAHQLDALAWLQHLWSLSPACCRGALLADDMGLGKTLEVLAFVASCLERQPDLDPVLIVAPVSLLDNWATEIDKFFRPGSLPYIKLYGSTKRDSLVLKDSIPADVRGIGVNKLLRKDWLGHVRIVITNYETLRDLELSLARQSWSIVVCDEAQTIKNPGALVTKAAKKQKSQFTIACTGTPVENTLVDLWSLFDLVQPGLLGSLSHFSNHYRKPIEVSSDSERQELEKLRGLVKPQILRRMKQDVASELPAKHEDASCKHLPMTDTQKRQYADLAQFIRSRQLGSGGRIGMAGLYALKTFFACPTPLENATHIRARVERIPDNSPKITWLITTLEGIRARGEKAIVFCELRDIQRTLQATVSSQLKIPVDIINGDSSTNYADNSSRRRRIEAFQAADGFGVIILSPLVAGFGLNIQEANHVIHFTRLWNPAKEDQATDRAYRIGQTRDVFVYCPVIVSEEFKTFDVLLDELLARKRILSADMLNGNSAITESDFRDLQNVDGSRMF